MAYLRNALGEINAAAMTRARRWRYVVGRGVMCFSRKGKPAMGELAQSAFKRFLHWGKNEGERCYQNPNITIEATFQAISHQKGIEPYSPQTPSICSYTSYSDMIPLLLLWYFHADLS